MSKNKTHHQRQVKGSYQQGRRREEECAPGNFSLKAFLKRYRVESLLLSLMILGIAVVFFLGPDRKAIREMSESVSSVISGQEISLDIAYPYGYKIIALRETDIIHTTYDTLPKDLKIDWKTVSIVRIQESQFGSIEEKIRIKMSGIDYAPADVLDRAVTTSFIRRKGAIVGLALLGNLELVVEIIEDAGDQVFCLFGLRDK